jgi:hypothetical protein
MHRLPRDISWTRYFGQVDDEIAAEVADASFPLGSALLMLPYEVGARYVQSVWGGYGRPSVDRLFDDAPRTLADWFAGYGAGRPLSSLGQPLECMPPLEVDGFGLRGADSLGAAGVAALLGAAAADGSGSASDIWLASSSGLRSDVVAVYAPSDESGATTRDATLLIWRLRFMTEAAARAFAERLPWDDVGRANFGPELVLAAGPGVTRDVLPIAIGRSCPTLDALTTALSTTARSEAPTAWIRELGRRFPTRPQGLD